MTKHVTARTQILTLAARDKGVHSSDLPEFKSAYFAARCHDLMGESLLFRAQLAHKHTRYFTDRATAERVQAESGYDRNRKVEQPPAARVTNKAQAFRKDAEVVFTPQTKFTACPGFKTRFEASAPSFIHSAVQSGRVTAAA
jgi:hypothetical protein